MNEDRICFVAKSYGQGFPYAVPATVPGRSPTNLPIQERKLGMELVPLTPPFLAPFFAASGIWKA
jgi:hypothetical protein